MELPASALRGQNLTAAATKALRLVNVGVKKLSDVEGYWGEKTKQGMVFVPLSGEEVLLSLLEVI